MWSPRLTGGGCESKAGRLDTIVTIIARRKRSSDSDLVDLATEFEGLPLIAAIVCAAVVLVLFELVLPVVMTSVGQSSLSHINYGTMFASIVRIIGAVLAVGILLFGLMGRSDGSSR